LALPARPRGEACQLLRDGEVNGRAVITPTTKWDPISVAYRGVATT